LTEKLETLTCIIEHAVWAMWYAVMDMLLPTHLLLRLHWNFWCWHWIH